MKRNRQIKIICCSVFLFLSSIIVAGGPDEINVVGLFGKWMYQENYIPYKLSKLKEGLFFKELFFNGSPYYLEALDVEHVSLMHRALEENQNLKTSDVPKEVVEAGDETTQSLGDTYTEIERTMGSSAMVDKLLMEKNASFLLKNFYIVDSTTSATSSMFDPKKLLSMNMALKPDASKKQILIYHTHGASEGYLSSEGGKTVEGSLIDTGSILTSELEKRGYGVYHDTTKYDLINGSIDRSLAYNKSFEGIKKILEKQPEIQVIIDLHRDGVGRKLPVNSVNIKGKQMAQVMFFNGLSRGKSGKIKYLDNPNLQGNLAFSLQLKCVGMKNYSGLTKPIYLKGYRYNLHLKKRSLLIELGNEYNTVDEAKNSAIAIADMLDRVLNPS